MGQLVLNSYQIVMLEQIPFTRLDDISSLTHAEDWELTNYCYLIQPALHVFEWEYSSIFPRIQWHRGYSLSKVTCL